MAERIPARLTASEGRKFAFPVGLAFLVFAGISFWRGHELPPRVLGGLGAAFLVAGTLFPASLGPVQRFWMGLAHAISKVTTPIFLGIVYFFVLTPTGLIMRLLGKNPMEVREEGGSYWTRSANGRSNLQNQF